MTPAGHDAAVPLGFTKVEGLANDFVLIDRRTATPEAVRRELAALRGRATALCDRRTGVGADGILVVGPPTTPQARATMTVINHDGSRPEMCGNGLRCVALFVSERSGDAFELDTDAGPRHCELVERTVDGRGGQVRVDMGPAEDLGERVPAGGGGRTFRAVSMGNPHAVAFVTEDPETRARTDGPAIEVDPLYPNRTNVEFARVEPDGSLTVWVWERGCGITMACGTGACATAAAAAWSGLIPRGEAVRIRLPGGSLDIRVPPRSDRGVEMTGPARLVFSGSV